MDAAAAALDQKALSENLTCLLAWDLRQRESLQRLGNRALLVTSLMARQYTDDDGGRACDRPAEPQEVATPTEARHAQSESNVSIESSDDDEDSHGGEPNSAAFAQPAPRPPPLQLAGSLSLALPKLPELALHLIDQTPPDEHESRAEKLRRFGPQCNHICDRVFLGSDQVARNLETLRTNGVTHVLNAAGVACPEYHPSVFSYKTLHLYDSPAQELAPVLYDALSWIADTLEAGGTVFIHCQQGVSRSASLAIAYVMWTKKLTFVEAHAFVKERCTEASRRNCWLPVGGAEPSQMAV
jgi:hypothetical protein